MIPQKLLDSFTHWVELSVDEKGIYPYPAFFNKENKIHVCSLDLSFWQCLDFFWTRLCKNECSAIIMGMDRYTNPGQGTEFADVLTVFCWWDDPDTDWRMSYKTGVINYQNKPRIVRPIDWDNAHWNKQMAFELKKTRPLFKVGARTSITPPQG